MRRGARSAALILIALAALVKPASATVTFSLVWTATSGCTFFGCGTATGTDTILASPGDVLTLSIMMTTTQTLAAHSVSLRFDTDLQNELNLYRPAGGAEWFGTSYGSTAMAGNYFPQTAGLGPPPAVESTGANAGSISTFESSTYGLGAFLPTGTYRIGTARFVAVQGIIDGDPDVFIGLFNAGDGVLDNLNNPIAPSGLVFSPALVIFMPEPSTASLVALGLVGLVVVSRRRRR